MAGPHPLRGDDSLPTAPHAQLLKVARAALGGGSPRELAASVCACLAAELGLECCAVLEGDAASAKLAPVAGVGWPAGVLARGPFPIEPESPEDRALRSGAPVVSAGGPDAPAAGALLGVPGVKAGVAAPIPGSDRPIGVLLACTRSPRRIEMDEVTVLCGAAALLSFTITSHRRYGELHESEARFLALAEHAGDLIAELGPDGRYVFLSRSYEDALGYARDELRRLDPFELIVPEDRDRVRGAFERSLAAGGTLSAEYRARLPEGRERWFETHANVFQTREGEPHAILISRDVTSRKEAEEALRESEIRLRQAQRLEAVGRLAGGVAHDFNNILTAIAGYCDLVLERLGAHDPLRSDVEEIAKAQQRAAALTRQLLAFGGQQRLAPQLVSLNGVVRDMDRLLRRLIGEDVELALRLDPRLGTLRADPSQLEQVIVNLAVNARDAMPRGGRLEIETANVDRGARDPSPLPGAPLGRSVALVLRDTGIGMSPEVRSRIFEPFFSTKPPGEGSGLGLATVYGIVRQSGGQIEVESEPGQGSAFFVFFPRVEALPQPQAAASPSPSRERRTETVLLAEDDAAVRDALQRSLEARGFQVLAARHGEEALALARGHPDPLHLLLTDVVMPRLGGRELAARLRAERPGIRVLYLSGYSEELSSAGELAPGEAFLQKPCAGPRLLEAVEALLDAAAPPQSP